MTTTETLIFCCLGVLGWIRAVNGPTVCFTTTAMELSVMLLLVRVWASDLRPPKRRVGQT